MVERRLLGKILLWLGFALEVIFNTIAIISLHKLSSDSMQITNFNFILIITILLLLLVLMLIIVGFKCISIILINLLILSLLFIISISNSKIPIGMLIMIVGCVLLIYKENII